MQVAADFTRSQMARLSRLCRPLLAVDADFRPRSCSPTPGRSGADRFGGEIARMAPEVRLAPARRKAVTQGLPAPRRWYSRAAPTPACRWRRGRRGLLFTLRLLALAGTLLPGPRRWRGPARPRPSVPRRYLRPLRGRSRRGTEILADDVDAHHAVIGRPDLAGHRRCRFAC